MSHVVAISPHLDDAAFSIGGLLAARARAGDCVTIVTCFTGNVAQPKDFALACQLDKGIGPKIDYMARRRAEDRAACAVIGADPVHLPFLEAPHRGYDDAAALFARRRQDDAVLGPLAEALAVLVERLAPDLLLGPLAIGDHVDHWIVRDALASLGRPISLWEDWPYLDRPGARRPGMATRTHRLADEDRAARLAMCRAYASQLDFQFGSPAELERRLGQVGEERLHVV